MSISVSVADLFDSHDDRDEDGEAGSVEEHKSVIMHLLSQVRLGMDLTKVRRTSAALPLPHMWAEWVGDWSQMSRDLRGLRLSPV